MSRRVMMRRADMGLMRMRKANPCGIGDSLGEHNATHQR
jgi:hypothetical protein